MEIGDKVTIASKSYVGEQIGLIDIPTDINTSASAILLNPSSLSTSITPDAAEESEATTSDYLIGDYIFDSLNYILYDCTADSTSGELLTNTDFFIINTTNILDITAGNFTYTEGVDSNGYVRSSEQYTGVLNLDGVSDGFKWVGRKLDGSGYVFEDNKPSGGLYNKQFADDNRLVFDTKTGKHYETTGGEFVPEGNFVTQSDVDAFDVENGTLTLDNSSIRVTQEGSSSASGTISFSTVIGEKYRVKFNFIYTNDGRFMLGTTLYGDEYYTSGVLSADSMEDIEFTANETTAYIRLNTYAADTNYTNWDNISVYKLEPTIDTEVSVPIGFFDRQVMVQSETPMCIREDGDKLPTNMGESVEYSGSVKAKYGEFTDGFDLGQEWVDVTSERSFGITYTNNTKKPIEVSATLTNDDDLICSIQVDVEQIDRYRALETNTSDYTLQAKVPIGATYIINDLSSGADSNCYSWKELR